MEVTVSNLGGLWTGVYLKLGGGGKVIEGREREKKRETTFEG